MDNGDGFNRDMYRKDAYEYFRQRCRENFNEWTGRIAKTLGITESLVLVLKDKIIESDFDLDTLHTELIGTIAGPGPARRAAEIIAGGSFRDKPRTSDEKYRGGLSKLDTNLIEIAEDGSVSGFEFKTNGPVTYANAMKASSQLFQLTHTIDERCSFHVHISVPGVQHVYGSGMQRHLTEYLLENFTRFPESMKSRFKHSDAPQFFRPHISEEKYSAVHFNERCKTWEFRLFGNIKNLKDAKTCIDLACEAMQYAYQMKLGRQVSETQRNWVEGRAWDSLMKRAMLEEFKPLTYLREGRHLRAS
jgi:hypothetical protein